LSSNGRFVLFTSYAPLVKNPQNSYMQVYMRDRLKKKTSIVSVSDQGEWANAHCEAPKMSADGRFIVFYTEATNLVPNDPPDTFDVFLRDRGTKTTRIIGLAPGGGRGNGHSVLPTISSDGRFIAFQSTSDNLLPEDPDPVVDIFIHDRDADGNGVFDELGGVSLALASLNSRGKKGNDASTNPCLSDDGRFLAFMSEASNLAPNDDNEVYDIFLRDRDVDENGIFDENGGMRTILVSRNAFGFVGDSASLFPSLSSDGRYLAYESLARNLIQSDNNGLPDLFLFDRVSMETILINRDSEGKQTGPASPVALPLISRTGRFVAYVAGGKKIVPDDTNQESDVFLFDRVRMRTVRVSLGSAGQEGDFRSTLVNGQVFPMSDNGRFIAFRSAATNLVPDDSNGKDDIFVRDRGRVDALDLAGPPSVAAGNTATFTLGGAPANLPFRLMAAGDLGGSFLFDHPFDLGPGLKTIATGSTDGAGKASWTSGPVPARLAGRTFFLEARVDEPSGLIWDSPPLRLDVL